MLVILAAGRSLAAEPSTRPQWDSAFVSVEVPRQVLTDQVFLAKVTMKNVGSIEWAGDNQPVLYSVDPEYNKTWGTHFIYMRQGNSAKPGQEFTFVSYLRAPSTAGEHAFIWRLGRKNSDGRPIFFGQSTAKQIITL